MGYATLIYLAYGQTLQLSIVWTTVFNWSESNCCSTQADTWKSL